MHDIVKNAGQPTIGQSGPPVLNVSAETPTIGATRHSMRGVDGSWDILDLEQCRHWSENHAQHYAAARRAQQPVVQPLPNIQIDPIRGGRVQDVTLSRGPRPTPELTLGAVGAMKSTSASRSVVVRTSMP